MSGIEALEREAAQLHQIIDSPSEQERAARRLAEVSAQIAAEKETTARTAAEDWLAKNALAIKKLAGSLDEMLERVRANPNQRDVASANKIWDLIIERARWAFVVERRVLGIKAPTMPELVPPGFRDLKHVAGLSVEQPGRLFHPIIVAWWPAEVRAQAYGAAAAEWIRDNGSRLPDDLRTILAALPPVSFVEPADPEPRGNERAVLAQLAGGLGQAAR